MSDDLGSLSMLDLFRTEVEGQASVLSNGLVGLEGQNNPAAIEPLMRAAHSIKGAARIIGLDAVVKVAHVMEDVLVAAQEGKLSLGSNGIDLLLRGVDFIVQASECTEEGLEKWARDHEAEQAQLEGLLGGIRDGKPVAAPVPEAAPAPPFSLENSSMLELFRGEAETQVHLLNEGLISLENSPEQEEALKTLMRAAHSLKGAARIVGLDAAVQVAHAMEDSFVAAQEKKIVLEPQHVDVLLKGVDFLSRLSLVSEAELPGWLEKEKASLAALMGLLADVKTGKTPAAAEPASAPAPRKAEGPAPESVPSGTPAAPAKPAAAAEAKAPKDTAVKVTAENLNRLIGLAAEALVETRQLKPFANSLMLVKKNQARLGLLLEEMRQEIHRLSAGQDAELHTLWHEAQAKLTECRSQVNGRINEFEEYSRRSENLSNRLYREVISSRMRPFSDGTQGFPRLVRDLARTLGKKVKFEILGRNTEVDRDILEKLEAPLNHILRNALDHGVETPMEREKWGKPQEATLKLEARHRAGMLYVSVSDDGRGINVEKLRTKVLDKKLTTPELAQKMSEAELLEFLFLPGFSTAEKVTEISGRGVGLDVVQDMVHEAGGSVRIQTQFGKGTSFHLQLPITRSVIRALLVEIAGEPYAFPLARIDSALQMPASQILTVEGRQYVQIEGQNVGLISAQQVLELESQKPAGENISLVLVSDRNHRYGLEVDGFLGERDLVVRPLDPRLGKVPDISSASLMEDGAPMLILDADDIVRSIDSLLSGGNLSRVRRESPALAEKKNKRVLVVDDSITVREVERKLLENNGYEVDVAVDGMEGWNAVRLGQYDLVISDVDMPRMNGIEFVRKMKAEARFKDLPVMIVSYKDREEDRLRGLDAGANYYLTKSSFHDETLLTAVKDLIGGPA